MPAEAGRKSGTGRMTGRRIATQCFDIPDSPSPSSFCWWPSHRPPVAVRRLRQGPLNGQNGFSRLHPSPVTTGGAVGCFRLDVSLVNLRDTGQASDAEVRCRSAPVRSYPSACAPMAVNGEGLQWGLKEKLDVRKPRALNNLAGWRNGRRKGLKILCPVRDVRVRVPLRLSWGARNTGRHSVFPALRAVPRPSLFQGKRSLLAALFAAPCRSRNRVPEGNAWRTQSLLCPIQGATT